MSTRPHIDEELGQEIVDRIMGDNGFPVNIILIVFPCVPDGQPGFVTNLKAEIMESALREIGEQLTEQFVSSRVEVPCKKDVN